MIAVIVGFPVALANGERLSCRELAADLLDAADQIATFAATR